MLWGGYFVFPSEGRIQANTGMSDTEDRRGGKEGYRTAESNEAYEEPVEAAE
jgi:hypothetical protein